MGDHTELLAEMPSLEKMSIQDRIKHAKKRRQQQLKRYNQYEKDQTKKLRKGLAEEEMKREPKISFIENVTLLEAAARGDVEEVKYLLENGLDPNLGNEDGLTALHQSCIDNNEPMMKLLLEHGADVNIIDRELWTPLHAAATCGHMHLAEYLISQGADLLAINSDGNMPYDICEDDTTLDYIEGQMAKRGISQEQIDDLRDVVPRQMLTDVKQHYDNGFDLDAADNTGTTLLHIAAANGYLDVAEWLLEHHADVNALDSDGWQPIHAAACWAQSDMLTLLVKYGADLESKTKNDETPDDICEDEDIRVILTQLKMEQVEEKAKRSNLVRRSSSKNRRSASVRRSSKRDKDKISRQDARAEAEFIHIFSEDLDSEEISALSPTDDNTTPPYPITQNGVGEPDESGSRPMSVIQEENNGVVQITAQEPQQTPLVKKPRSILKRHDELAILHEGGKLITLDEDAVREREQKERDLEHLKEKEKENVLKKEKEKEALKKSKEDAKREKKRLDKEHKKVEHAKSKKEKGKHSRFSWAAFGLSKSEKYHQEKYNSGNHETLSELKRQRSSSHPQAHFKPTENPPTTEKESQEMDNNTEINPGQKRRWSRNLNIPTANSSGSYSLKDSSLPRKESLTDSNGIGEHHNSESTNAAEPNAVVITTGSDPPLKRFTAIEPEVIGEKSVCCILM
ncbi:protein phosphatase 1 regulatory subunit 16A-like [Anneissia japonica]|uniref:protein phosphatase 1 regulatory subunit 16A-like n=1 Tax=Anneissia japonica TaxID=1529436 RepID=UPI0014255B19|nr:protein phosphatase 1 regulatory subunit 16A-like [Anneissia japonica]